MGLFICLNDALHLTLFTSDISNAQQELLDSLKSEKGNEYYCGQFDEIIDNLIDETSPKKENESKEILTDETPTAQTN
jgi:hypothetical protein